MSVSARLALGLSDATCDRVDALAWHHRRTAPRRAPVHPLVLAHAQKKQRAAVGFAVDEGRLGSWANSSRLFHMTHIAKTGGRSVRLELLRLVRPVGGAEQCYPPFAHDSRVNIIFFREPRGHALSQYLHGAYAGRTARRRAAGYPVVAGDDVAGFAAWVRHFARGWTPARGDFYGYNPLNMAARTLTCTDERWNCDYIKECERPCAHHVGGSAVDARPPLAAALAAVHTADFVGALELLPESLCLVEWRRFRRLSAHCSCATGEAARGGGGGRPRIAHVMNSRRQRAAKKVTIAQVPPATIGELDEVTAVDARVYRAVVLRLLCDLRALERATGAAVICDARLEALRNKTRYVPGLWDGTAAASLAEEWAEVRTPTAK
jgi:hypothetical protein